MTTIRTHHLAFAIETLTMVYNHPYQITATDLKIWLMNHLGFKRILIISIRMMKLLSGGLTHLPLHKMVAISQTIFLDAFSWMKTFVFWLWSIWQFWLWSNWQLPSIGLNNGLALNSWQAPLSEPMLTRFTDAYMRHWWVGVGVGWGFGWGWGGGGGGVGGWGGEFIT